LKNKIWGWGVAQVFKLLCSKRRALATARKKKKKGKEKEKKKI
jgi:hypothetical protein